MRTPHATFDEHDHCDTAGWAPYHDPEGWRQRLCRHRRIDLPRPKNDYCPQAFKRCPTCGICGRWFDVGSHHFGGISRYFANLTPDGCPQATTTPENVECPTCQGVGSSYEDHVGNCPDCGGEGVTEPDRHDHPDHGLCPTCGGTGCTPENVEES